jgi:hypothetical protein
LAATPQYKARTDITTGYGYLYGMSIADFNGDGKPDIAATDSSTNKIYVYLNNGTGSFGTAKPSVISTLPSTIAAGDFNEDGKQDLIVSVFSGSPLLLTGNGDGTFTQQTNTTAPGCVTYIVADLNQDKHADVICGGNGSLAAYSGDGYGNFQKATGFELGSAGLFTGLASADFNKDGKLDFVAVSPVLTAGIRYYAGYGDATFASSLLLQNTTISAPGSIAAADFDGDENTDLLVSSGFFSYIISGAGNGTFDLASATRLPLSSSSSITVPPGTLTVVSPWVAAADLDGDGKTDVITANTYTTMLGLLVNDGTGKFPSTLTDFTHPIDAGTSQLNTADLNGDGLPDIILANNTTQNISVFLSIKPRVAATATLTPSANPQLVGSGVTFTAQLVGSGSNIPTGTVTLLDGTTSIGQQTLDANAQATFSLASLSTGQHSLTVSYSGDSNFLPSRSSALTQSIADFQIAMPITSQSVTAGGIAIYNLDITPTGGLTGSIAITCSNLPPLASCDPVTGPITNQPAIAMLTVRTTAPVVSRSRSTIHAASLSLMAIALTLLLPLRRRRPIQLLAVTVALALVGSITGCSGGSAKSAATTPGTPQGTTQFTITSSVILGGQTLTRSSTATLVVQ